MVHRLQDLLVDDSESDDGSSDLYEWSKCDVIVFKIKVPRSQQERTLEIAGSLLYRFTKQYCSGNTKSVKYIHKSYSKTRKIK